MKTAIYSTKSYERDPLVQANREQHELLFLEPRLSVETAALARGCRAVSVLVNDCVDGPVLELLAGAGVRLVALRCAGYNADLAATRRLGVTVARVPAYSPYAVAEHTVGMILTLNRKLHRAYNRVRER